MVVAACGATTKLSLLSCLITIGPEFAKPERQQKLFQQQEKHLAKEAAEANGGIAAHTTPTVVSVPAQAQSPEDIFTDVLPACDDPDPDNQAGDAGLGHVGQPDPGQHNPGQHAAVLPQLARIGPSHGGK